MVALRARSLLPVALATLASCTEARVDGAACRPRRVLATEQLPRLSTAMPFTAAPTCRAEADGAIVLRFEPPTCDPDNSWWAGCHFARRQDLQAFDLVGAGRGVLVAHVCVENLVRSTVNVRFGPPGQPDKFLRVISGDEAGFHDGCRTVYLGPADACYGEACGRVCRPPGSDVGADRSDGGATATPSNTCTSFADSDVILMNEWCRERGATATGPVTIRLEALTYYPAGCECRDDQSCAAPSVCRRDGWRDHASCLTGRDVAQGCPGICADGG